MLDNYATLLHLCPESQFQQLNCWMSYHSAQCNRRQKKKSSHKCQVTLMALIKDSAIWQPFLALCSTLTKKNRPKELHFIIINFPSLKNITDRWYITALDYENENAVLITICAHDKNYDRAEYHIHNTERKYRRGLIDFDPLRSPVDNFMGSGKDSVMWQVSAIVKLVLV